MRNREKLITDFVRLGVGLSTFGHDPLSESAISEALAGNSWFSRRDIIMAVEAIAAQMLDRTLLEQWSAKYPCHVAGATVRSTTCGNTLGKVHGATEYSSHCTASDATPPKAEIAISSAHPGERYCKPLNVVVIMAGNIPLVGFFDLICVVMSGHRCFIKPSSKDRALMDYVVSLLLEIDGDIPIYPYAGEELDAVIATGSGNTARHFHSVFRGLPAIIRGNRASAAILAGDETAQELAGLAADIFSYSGLGCRNVSHLLLPNGYNTGKLLPPFNGHGAPNLKYINNFVQRSAALQVQGEKFTKGDFFILREAPEFPVSLSEITFHTYGSQDDIDTWLAANDSQLQCIVGRNIDHPRAAGFGRSQSPSLSDYPDGTDTMAFLLSLY